MKTWVVAAAVLALGACASHANREGERTIWRCGPDQSFSLRHVSDGIEVFAAGQTFRLDPAPGADGQYTNGTVTYAENGGRATLTGVYGGPYENCERRRSDWWFDFW